MSAQLLFSRNDVFVIFGKFFGKLQLNFFSNIEISSSVVGGSQSTLSACESCVQIWLLKSC